MVADPVVRPVVADSAVVRPAAVADIVPVVEASVLRVLAEVQEVRRAATVVAGVVVVIATKNASGAAATTIAGSVRVRAAILGMMAGRALGLPSWIKSQLPSGVRDQTIATGGERMHVVEWGPEEGHAIVLVHGNPTWSFLWRKVVSAIRVRPGGDKLRLIAPDLIGLGLSTKPKAAAHSLDHHGAWLGEVIDKLVPGPLVLVGQDWGGPIGLRAMAERRDRLRGIVLGNTAIGPPAARFKPTLFHRLSQTPILSDLLFRGLGFPLGLLHTSQGDRSTIRGDVARAYRWPLRHVADRAAPLALARMVPNSQHHPSIPALQKSETVFRTAQVPIALVWGTKDPILGRVIGHVSRLRPDASVVRTSAGHFLQEEVPEALADAVLDVASRANWS
jgi:haloalkane dehalogenase